MANNDQDKIKVAFVTILVAGAGIIVTLNLTLYRNSLLPLLPFDIVAFLILIYLTHLLIFGIPQLIKSIVKWRKTPDRKLIRLIYRYDKENIVAFQILNKEFRKPFLRISKLQVASDKDEWLFVVGQNIFLKREDRNDLFYTYYDKPHRYFKISNYEDDHEMKKVYGCGIYEFDVVIQYGFSERGNEWVKRYKTTLSFEENGEIKVLGIKHADEKKGKATRL